MKFLVPQDLRLAQLLTIVRNRMQVEINILNFPGRSVKILQFLEVGCTGPKVTKKDYKKGSKKEDCSKKDTKNQKYSKKCHSKKCSKNKIYSKK